MRATLPTPAQSSTRTTSRTSFDVEPVEAGGTQVLCPQDNGGSSVNCDPGQICCVTGDPQTNQAGMCQSSGSQCGGTPVSCAATADCDTNQVCCGTETSSGGPTTYTDVTCAKTCAGTNRIRFCDPAANDCPVTQPTCQPSQLLLGYNVCE